VSEARRSASEEPRPLSTGQTVARKATGAPVALIGASGALGFGLAIRFARAGLTVAIGSRDAERGAATVERARETIPHGSFLGLDNSGAVRVADTVVLSVPFSNQAGVLRDLRDELRPGQLLIDTTVPLAAAVGGDPDRMLSVWEGSAAEQALELVPPGVRVVSALHTVSAASLTDLEHPLGQDVLLCGDSAADKREAARLIERIEGLRCVDCGRLESSRITESLTALMIAVKLRYTNHAGFHLTGLPAELWR
jgi:8-hydroxy-5-deazaflavin:NADPH oxidoreductase